MFAQRLGPLALLLLALVLMTSCGRTPGGPSPDQATDAGGLSAAGGSSSVTGPSAAAAEHIELILVPEAEPWLLAVAAPLAARLRRGDRMPYLLALCTPPGKDVRPLLSRLAPRRSLWMAPTANAELAEALPGEPPEVFLTGVDPLMASLLVAKRFWGTSSAAVVASRDDAAAMVLGSALAAQLSVPLLIRTASDEEDLLQEGLDGLGVQHLVLAASHADRAAVWARQWNGQTTVLEPAQLQQRLIAALGAAKLRTVVVARVPDEAECVGGTAWLAPYVSLVRGGPVVLCRSPAAGEVEANVAQLIGQQQIRPRSVTILADYDSIGCNRVRINGSAERLVAQRQEKSGTQRQSTGSSAAARHSLEAGSDAPRKKAADDDDEGSPPYEVETEPCVPTTFGQVVSMSVGRIPLASLEDATALFVGGLLRTRLLAEQSPRMLMIANPNLEEPLPLCEVVGRVTAGEYKNCRVQVDEFYRKPAGAPEVMAAMRTAHLIIYQGHGFHDWLFRSPADAARPRPQRSDQKAAHDSPSPNLSQRERSFYDSPSPNLSQGERSPGGSQREKSSVGSSQKRRGRRFKEPLEGLPVVVLQACHSLHENVLQQARQLGGVALLGSSTPIHSGSGTAFAKAFSNGLLYRGDTLGEALRDAQNYLFCLQDLGGRRGHQEQAKMQRVALSFRLWGDPELQVFPRPVAKPIYPPVSIGWDAPDRLKIRLPAKRLAPQKADGYTAWLFPGSETAAMVQRADDTAGRMLTPVHFFRLPLTKAFLSAGYSEVERSVDASARAVFRIDPVNGFLYVLYFPNKESPKKTFTLQFTKPASTGDALGSGVCGLAALLPRRSAESILPHLTCLCP